MKKSFSLKKVKQMDLCLLFLGQLPKRLFSMTGQNTVSFVPINKSKDSYPDGAVTKRWHLEPLRIQLHVTNLKTLVVESCGVLLDLILEQ